MRLTVPPMLRRAAPLFLFALLGCGDVNEGGGNGCPNGVLVDGPDCHLDRDYVPCDPPPRECPSDEHHVALIFCGYTFLYESGRPGPDGGEKSIVPASDPLPVGCQVDMEWCSPDPADEVPTRDHYLRATQSSRSWRWAADQSGLDEWSERQPDGSFVYQGCCGAWASSEARRVDGEIVERRQWSCENPPETDRPAPLPPPPVVLPE